MKEFTLKLFCVFLCLGSYTHAIRELAVNSRGEYGTLLSPQRFADSAQDTPIENKLSWQVPGLARLSYFGKTPQAVHVHFNGFLTFNNDSRILSDVVCIEQASNNIDLVSVYASRYTQGAVYAMDVTRNTTITNLLRADLMNALQTSTTATNNGVTTRVIDGEDEEGFEEEFEDRPRNNGQFRQVIALTWLKMRGRGIETNTFQAFLVLTGYNQWFVVINYRSIDTNFVSLTGQPDCTSKVGVSRTGVTPTNTNSMGLENFGFLGAVPNWGEYFSNSPRFQDLGTFVFDLNVGVGNQPIPRQANCPQRGTPNRYFKCFMFDELLAQLGRRKRRAVEQPYHFNQYNNNYNNAETTRRPRSTQSTDNGSPPTGITRTELSPAANRFCEFRDVGTFGFSPVCNAFIFCRRGSDGRGIAEVGFCPRGQNFNQRIKRCDLAERFTCFITGVDVSGLNLPTSVVPTRPDICFNRPDGNYADPSTCKGYIACTNGRAIQMPCPAGLFFNVRNFCDWPRNVNCRNGVRSSPSSGTKRDYGNRHHHNHHQHYQKKEWNQKW